MNLAAPLVLNAKELHAHLFLYLACCAAAACPSNGTGQQPRAACFRRAAVRLTWTFHRLSFSHPAGRLRSLQWFRGTSVPIPLEIHRQTNRLALSRSGRIQARGQFQD